MNIFDKIKEVISKMLGKKEVSQAIGVSVSISGKMKNALSLWCDMYENDAPWLSDSVRSKNLAAAISAELARLVTLEFTSELSGGKRAEFLSGEYDRIISESRVFTEYACAKGGLMLKPYISAGKIVTAFVQADSFFPTAFDSSGNITGGVFADRKTKGSRYYTRLEYHDFSPVGYVIRNYAFVSDNSDSIGRRISLTDVPEWADLQEEVSIGNAKRPLFSYFKMPGANNIDSGSPLGVSVFARAVDSIKQADEQYSRLLWEFEGSELAVHVDETVLELSGNGKASLPKLNKRLYRGLSYEGGAQMEVFSPAIREQSLLNGLDAILRDVEYLSGLAYGTLSKMDDTAKTATEIKASRQRSYSTVSAIQKALKTALENHLEAMEMLCDIYSLAPRDKIEQSIDFGDSLITDNEYEQKVWLQEVSAGLMSPVEYRMKRYGETEEQAKAALPNSFGDDE